MDSHEQLRELQRELRQLKQAIPPLPEPQQLYDRIVQQCHDNHEYTETTTQLEQRLRHLQSTCDSDNFLHDIDFLDLQVEHLRLQFVYSRSQLRILFSLPPLLIAMKKVSLGHVNGPTTRSRRRHSIADGHQQNRECHHRPTTSIGAHEIDLARITSAEIHGRGKAKNRIRN
ncbi:hypothetical protein Q1695_008286 [Nippostrongylus brasiliensis]|nr:hypothetical protein Q1695_008286 [Nippostrongylus brasiliensis]